jgi:D-methionine transport system substrate-binding protein
MKKLFVLLFAAVLLVGCSTKETVKVAATSVPHAEILEEAKELLSEQGIELEIVVVQDYVTPNQFLDSGDVDLNYFQHIPYLEAQKAEFGYDFEIAARVHIEPIGVYSNVYDNANQIEDGAKVIFSSSVADHGRILSLLEAKGLITLKSGVDKQKATVADIESNPKNLEFVYDIEASLLPKVLENNEGELVVINTNYALQAGLNPLEDAIIIEGAESLYVNVLAVETSRLDEDVIKKIVDVLTSEQISDFIKAKYEGSVVPVN